MSSSSVSPGRGGMGPVYPGSARRVSPSRITAIVHPRRRGTSRGRGRQLVESGEPPAARRPVHRRPRRQPVTALDLETYRRRAEEFVGALDMEHYQHFAGLKAECDTAAVYDRYPELFTRDAVDELEALYAGRRGRREAAPRVPARLRRRRLHGRADQAAQRRDRQHRGRSTTITVDGETIGLRQAERRAGQRGRPGAPRAHPGGAPGRHAPSTSTRCSTASGGAATSSLGELGYPNYEELYSEVKGLDYGLLRARAETLPAGHRGPLRARHRQAGRASAWASPLTRAALRRPAVPRARPGYDARLPRRAPLPTLARTLAGLGIDLAAQTQRPPRRRGRASSSRRAPSARRCACPTRSTSSSCPRAARTTTRRCSTRPGTPSTSPTSGPSLPSSTATSATTPSPRASPSSSTTSCSTAVARRVPRLRRRRRVRRLRQPRRALLPAPLRGQARLRDRAAHADGPARRHGRALQRAAQRRPMIDVPAANYLVDVDDGFYCANYLRAWMLEGALRMMLQDRYGMEWFRDPAAGALAQGPVVRRASSSPPSGCCSSSGGGRLDADPLKHLSSGPSGADARRRAGCARTQRRRSARHEHARRARAGPSNSAK